jgi:DNA topoisomerase I
MEGLRSAVRGYMPHVARKGGWRRRGSKSRGFRYYDAKGREITDAEKLDRIEKLSIPPAWREVWISPSARAKLQAVGLDRAGRRQYLYHPAYRAQQEQAKYDKLVRFGEKLPEIRTAMAEHMDRPLLDRERACAIALRIINLGWFRPGSERYAKASRTYGITTLRKGHVKVRGHRISFNFRAKHKVWVRTALVDSELADSLKELLALKGGTRLFRYENEGELQNVTERHLNEYIQTYMGDEFTAKDFRTWGGTLLAAIGLAEHGVPETETQGKRVVTAVCRTVAEKLGNTPAVCRASYISPAVVEQYMDGRTIDDFRPRHLRVVSARDTGLDLEEQALLSLLRSWRIRQARQAA